MMLLYLRILVFLVGMVTLGTELTASRLLAPYFGTSLPVWSSLIGLILLALSLGYALGGRLADRAPNMRTMLHIVLAAGVILVFLPAMGRPLMAASLKGFASLNAGILVSSFFSILALLGLPMVLLGCLTPFAVRLATENVSNAGKTAGGLFAWSTLGSFAGSLLPVLLLIPALGTALTFVLFGAVLILACIPGYIMVGRIKPASAAAALMLGAACFGNYFKDIPIKPGTGVLFEGESIYQYVRVEETRQGTRHLLLNEGLVSHSIYRKDKILTFGEWDYFALAPCFNPAPYAVLEKAQRWALIGSGAGTTARLISNLYGPVAVTGVELDPMVAEAGRRYFDMDRPNFTSVIQDGRAWITLDTGHYDVIGIDAYRQPYIPFELATVEFFQLAKERLNASGVVCVNGPQPMKDRRIVNALAATMSQVFPSVFIFNLRDNSQTVLVAGTREPATLQDFRRNTETLTDPLMRQLVFSAQPRLEVFTGAGTVLTDDHAPVERLMDMAMIQAMFKGAKVGGPGG